MLYDANCPEDLKGVRTHEGVGTGNRDNARVGWSGWNGSGNNISG